VLFTLIAQDSTLKLAAVAALAVSATIALPSLLKGARKCSSSERSSRSTSSPRSRSADPATSASVARYARAIAAMLPSLIAFGSLLFVAFTEQYARESVPRQFLSSPRFRQINRQLTTMWALVFAAMVPFHVIAGAIDTHRANVIFNWAIPLVLIMWAVKRTAAVSGAAAGESR
jgi:hypothetical protein